MLNWFKHAFFKGLIVLIPLVLLWITLRELVELLIAFAQPIADFLPPDTLEWIEEPEFVAPVLIVLIALILGGLASIPMVRKAAAWLEGHTLGYLPFYRMIKTFITAFLEVENTSSFRPALILDDEGGAEPCYIIEESENHANVVVLVPWSPASFAGSVKLVPKQRIRRLDLTFDELSLRLANFGLGMNSVLELQDSTGTDNKE
jgi:uncharacterized membrane protein